MTRLSQATFTRYGVAVAAVTLATALRALLTPVLGELYPFPPLFLAVLVAAAWGGFGPALTATVLGAVASAGFLLPGLATPELAGLGLYLGVSLGIAVLGGGLHEARTHAENLLARAVLQREELRTTLASIGDAVIVTDSTGRVASLNSVAAELTGWSDAEARGRPLAEIFVIRNELTGQPAENPVERVLHEGTVVGLANHTVLVARDGSERPIDDSAAPIHVAGGTEIRGVVLVFRDVSQRRRAEEASHRLAAIVASSDDAIVGKTLDGVITNWNAGAERLYGYSAAEALGRPFAFLVPPERSAEVQDSLRRLRAGERLDHYETVRQHKDGHLLDVSVSYSPIHDEDGRLIGAAVIARDITDRKRAEAALRERERQLRLVTDTAQVLLAQCDAQMRYKFVNRPYAEHLGLQPEDIAGKTIAEVLGAEAFEVIRPHIEAVLAGQRVEFEADIPYRDLGTQHMLVVYEPELDEAGRPVGYVGAILNITERRRVERALAEEARTTETLYRVGRSLAANLDLQSLVQTVTNEATALTGAAFGAFFYNVLNERGESYTLYALSGAPREAFAQFPMPRNTEIFEPTFRGQEVVRLDDVIADPRYGRSAPHHGMPEGHLPVRSYLAVPVVSRSGEVLGGLFFGHPEPGVFTERHEQLVVGIATQAAVAIDNARLYRLARESEARLAAIINHSPAVIFLKDPEGRYLLVNQRFEDLAGHLGIPGPYLGRSDAELLPPGLAEQFCRDDREVLVTRQTRTYEETVEVGGERRTTLTTKFPLLDEAGTPYAICGISLDLTDRVRAEAALRESEERLRLALEAGSMGVWDWDVRTNRIAWSDSLEAMHGLKPGTFPGTFEAFQALIHPEDHDAVVGAIGHALQTLAPYEMEFRSLWPDGSVRWTVGKGQVYTEEGRPARMLGVCLDVTARKRGEQDARFLADASAALAALSDFESTLQKVARLAVGAFADWCVVDLVEEGGGLRRVAVAHSDPTRTDLARRIRQRPSDPAMAQGVWNVVRTGQPQLIPHIAAEKLAGADLDPDLLSLLTELGPRSYMGVPLAVRGRVLGVVTFLACESGRNYDEADLAVAEDLAHRAAVTLENARLYEEVREADRRKDEFLAVLGHELRNPLAPISNALHVLRRPDAGALADQARDMMERQVQHMVRLVDDLLDVSRIVRGKVELRLEPVDLAAVVARAVEASQPLIEAEGHVLSVALPPRPVRVQGDLVRLAQVVGNLINNAARYTPPGGRISVEVTAARDSATVRVRDTGAGIPREALPRIWDMFVQADRRMKGAGGGLGIGLTLVKSLTELHGGSVEAHSEGPGRGSEFVVRLPLLPEVAPTARPQPATRPAPARARKVLIVDDNVDAAESLALLLQLAGHHARVAHDGPTALRLAEEDPPEVAFLDLGMPGMDGYEVARRFRQHPALQGVFLVALTGWGQDEDRRRTREAGFDAHEVKPIDPEAVRLLLERPRTPEA